MRKLLSNKHRVGTACFAFISFLLFCLLLWALLNPPSKHENNPYSAYSNEQNTNPQFVPIPCVDAENKTTRKCTDREVEQYYADRSALRAQWESADKAYLGFYAGLLGIALLFWTLYETFAAAKALSKQNDIALKTARAEYQPYLKFSDNIRFNFLEEVITQMDEFGEPTSMDYFFGDALGRMPIEFYLKVENKGKSPITNGMVRVNATVRDRTGPKPKLTWPEFSVKDECNPVLKYLAPNDDDQIFFPIKFITNPKIWKAWKSAKLVDGGLPLVKKSVRKLDLEIQIWVSFDDQFFDGARRTFYAKYGPFFDRNGMLKRIDYQEVENTEKDNPEYWKAIEATHDAAFEA